jgi:2-desacetyl-2-hydroxyethyl bacteriochlorophyllide A dehydrogenase
MKIKKVVVTGQHQVELQDATINESVGDDELLIETDRSFISAGTELAVYTGKEERVFQPGQWCTYPTVPGYANAGTVIAVGNNVKKTEVGRRVFTFSKHASVVKVNQNKFMIEIPDGIESSIAAASRMAAVAGTSIIVSDLGLNPWVVIYGLGAVGNLAAQSFQNMGCSVIGVDPTASRCDLARKCGIAHTVSGTPEEVKEAIRELTGGKMAQISVDAVGHSGVIMQAIKSTASHGQLILLGSPRVPVQGNLTELLSDIHMRWITVRGALEWCLPIYSDFPNTPSLYSKQELIFRWIRQGKLILEPMISHHVRPEQFKDGYDGLLNHPEAYTGVVIDWKN